MAPIGLTVAALCATLVMTQLPASADVTTNDYTIGTPTGSVSAVSVTPQSVGTSTSTTFQVSFTTPNALSGATNGWVSISPSEALGSAPSSVALAGGACIQTGTSGAGGAGTATATQVTIELSSSCTIAAGSAVKVYITANSPASPSNLDFNVSTSANATAAATNNIAVGTSAAALSAAHYSFGDNTTYSITGVPVGTNGAGSTVTLIAVVTSGSEEIDFAGAAADYSVNVTPSGGGTAASDVVQSANSSGGSVALALATPLTVGETLSITAEGTNPAASGTVQADKVAVNVNSATTVTTNSITFGNSVTAVSVSTSNNVAGAKGTYVVTFKTSTAGTGDVFIDEPAGPTQFNTVSAAEVVDNSQGWTSFTAVSILAGGVAEIPLGGTTNAGDVITVTLSNVTNPPAGLVSDFMVWTTNDAVAATAAAFSIGANASPGVSVTVTPTNAGAEATYAITNLIASSALAAGSGTIEVTAPAGTTFPNDPADYTVVDNTSNSAATVAASLTGGATNSVTFTVPINIASGDKLTLSIADVINPPTASSTDSLSLVGNVTGPPPTPTTTTTTVPTTTTTVPKPPKPSVSFTTKVAHITKKSVALRVYCKGAACKGTIKLTDVRTIVGSKTYKVNAGTSKQFTFTINQQGLSMAAKAPAKTITVTESVSVSGGKTVSKKISLVDKP